MTMISSRSFDAVSIADSLQNRQDSHSHPSPIAVKFGISVKRKVLPRATRAHWAALISVSIAISQTPTYTARPRVRD